MKNVSPHLHLADVQWVGVAALPILDRVGKSIGELFLSTKKIRLHKVDHSVVCVGRGGAGAEISNTSQ